MKALIKRRFSKGKMLISARKKSWLLSRGVYGCSCLVLEALASAWVTTITEKVSSFWISYYMAFVAFLDTDTADTTIIFEVTSVAEVPVLVSKILLSDWVCAILLWPFHIAHGVFFAVSDFFLLETFNLNFVYDWLLFRNAKEIICMIFCLFRYSFRQLSFLPIILSFLDLFTILPPQVNNLSPSILGASRVLNYSELAHEV